MQMGSLTGLLFDSREMAGWLLRLLLESSGVSWHHGQWHTWVHQLQLQGGARLWVPRDFLSYSKPLHVNITAQKTQCVG
jgi:hypothetical protein